MKILVTIIIAITTTLNCVAQQPSVTNGSVTGPVTAAGIPVLGHISNAPPWTECTADPNNAPGTQVYLMLIPPTLVFLVNSHRFLRLMEEHGLV